MEGLEAPLAGLDQRGDHPGEGRHLEPGNLWHYNAYRSCMEERGWTKSGPG